MLTILLITILLTQLKTYNKTMGQFEDLSAQIDALQTSIDAKQDQIATAIAAFEATIADLQSQLASGMTPEQVQTLLDKLTAAKTDIEGTPTV